MGRQSDQKLLRLRAPRIRRAFMMFLAFTYLFVGLVHATEHASENLSATISTGISVAATDGSDDDGSKKSASVAEHCHIFATVLMPVLAPVATRSIRSVRLSFVVPKLLLEDHPWLDTPPPKHLT